MTLTNVASVESELIRAAERLAQTGSTFPRKDALAVWAAMSHVRLGDAWIHRHDEISHADVLRFREAIERRGRGEPLPYVAKVAAFRHLELEVDHNVLIPRPETEGLVELALKWSAVRVDQGPLSGFEIGVGSGCIILSLAMEGHFERLLGTDISQDALRVARRNLASSGLHANVRLEPGSFYESAANERFDLIVSNPPYISETEYADLDRSVRDHEPSQALVSADDGMHHIRQICLGAPEHLNPGGLLLLEIDERRGSEARTAAQVAGFRSVQILQDWFGCDRYLRASMVLR